VGEREETKTTQLFRSPTSGCDPREEKALSGGKRRGTQDRKNSREEGRQKD